MVPVVSDVRSGSDWPASASADIGISKVEAAAFETAAAARVAGGVIAGGGAGSATRACTSPWCRRDVTASSPRGEIGTGCAARAGAAVARACRGSTCRVLCAEAGAGVGARTFKIFCNRDGSAGLVEAAAGLEPANATRQRTNTPRFMIYLRIPTAFWHNRADTTIARRRRGSKKMRSPSAEGIKLYLFIYLMP